MKNRIPKLLLGLLVAAMAKGCSLLKVAVSTGDPLPKNDLELRVMTRGFYYDMASEVARAADSIATQAPDAATRIRAIRWKIRATRAGVSAAMQGIPEVALADLWILCRRMHEGFARRPDSLLFGVQSPIAREVAARLDVRVARLARQQLPNGHYELLARFVEKYVRENPLRGENDGAANTTLAWLEFMRANGREADIATGSIAEVISDVNDRLSGQTQQLSNSIGWSKDLLEIEFRQDSMGARLAVRLDSLDLQFRRIATVAEHLPEVSDSVMVQIGAQLTQLLDAVDATVDNAFADVGRQRMALQHYVTGEREELVAQLRTTAEELLRTVFDAVPELIGKILLYLVLALVVLIGGPFALGFWLGGVRQRARERKN